MSTASTSSTSTGTALLCAVLRCTRFGAAIPVTAATAAASPAASAIIEVRIGVSLLLNPVMVTCGFCLGKRPVRLLHSNPDRLVGMHERKAQGVGYRFVSHMALVDIEPVAQMRVFRERTSPALVRQREHERNSGVAEREGRRARYRARHIGDAVMYYAVDQISRIRMRGGARSFGTAALVDRDIHNHRALFHQPHGLGRNEFRRLCAGHKHCGDDEIGTPAQRLHHVLGGEEGAYAAA